MREVTLALAAARQLAEPIGAALSRTTGRSDSTTARRYDADEQRRSDVDLCTGRSSSRARAALVEVIGQMEGMRPPSTRMMLPVM